MESQATDDGPRGIHRRIQFEVTPALVARFESKINKDGPVPAHDPSLGKCWLWTGAPRNGYGAIKHENKVLGTHVVAYVIANGHPAAGELVTHKCDVRMCCNPAHLQAGTPTDNVIEMLDRRRRSPVVGVMNYNAVLTDDLARLIKAYKVFRGIGCRRIARILDLKENTVHGVLTEKNWKHVAWPELEAAKQIVEAFESSRQQGAA